MKDVKAFIELGNDGTYSIYLEDNDLSYAIIGDGTTVQEALEDFHITYDDMRILYKDENKKFEEVDFIFEYDVPSFLNYYSKILSKSGLEKITGIHQKQLWNYANGLRKPKRETILRIQESLHKFAKDLAEIRLIN